VLPQPNKEMADSSRSRPFSRLQTCKANTFIPEISYLPPFSARFILHLHSLPVFSEYFITEESTNLAIF
jgi:hypothetical protein